MTHDPVDALTDGPAKGPSFVSADGFGKLRKYRYANVTPQQKREPIAQIDSSSGA
jgi:hypothetical protein